MIWLCGHLPWALPLRISVGGHMGLWIRWGHRAQLQFCLQPLPYRLWSRCEVYTGPGGWHLEYSFLTLSHYI